MNEWMKKILFIFIDGHHHQIPNGIPLWTTTTKTEKQRKNVLDKLMMVHNFSLFFFCSQKHFFFFSCCLSVCVCETTILFGNGGKQQNKKNWCSFPSTTRKTSQWRLINRLFFYACAFRQQTAFSKFFLIFFLSKERIGNEENSKKTSLFFAGLNFSFAVFFGRCKMRFAKKKILHIGNNQTFFDRIIW